MFEKGKWITSVLASITVVLFVTLMSFYQSTQVFKAKMEASIANLQVQIMRIEQKKASKEMQDELRSQVMEIKNQIKGINGKLDYIIEKL